MRRGRRRHGATRAQLGDTPRPGIRACVRWLQIAHLRLLVSMMLNSLRLGKTIHDISMTKLAGLDRRSMLPAGP